MKEVTKVELYKELAEYFISLITSNKDLDSYEQARVLNFAQRCKNDGELEKKTAPNIPNALALLKEKSAGRYTVESLEMIKIIDNESTDEENKEKVFLLKKHLKYGSKYNRRLQKNESSKTETVDIEPQDITSEQGLPATE
jgi:hypothetical protein